MKTALLALLLGAAAVLGHFQALGDTNDLTAALQKGLFEEEANHNLNAAIEAYQSVIGRFDQDRKLAATAVFRLAECYRKQGKTNDATALYQRVLREFSDQEQLVSLSQKSISDLGAASSTTGRAEFTPAQVAQRDLLQQEIRLLEDRLRMQESRLKSGVGSEEQVMQAQRDILAAKRQLAAIVPALMDLNVEQPTVTSTEAEEIKRIQLMIKDSPDLINAKDKDGKTPLHRAAESGQLVVGRFLLDNGADVEAADRYGRTPLLFASANGHKAIVELLLDRKADPNKQGDQGNTALHRAAASGYKSVLEVLIAHGANINAANNAGETPLHQAVNNDRKAIAETLLANKADVNARTASGATPLHSAANAGNEGLVSLLLAHGADVNAKDTSDTTPLMLAVGSHRTPVVNILLANKADPNIPTKEANDPQRQVGQTVPMRFPGGQSKPSSQEPSFRYPLYVAVQQAFQDVTRLLLDNGAKPNVLSSTMKVTPLWIATRNNQPELLKLLLEYKADPNIPDSRGSSPLHSALAEKKLMSLLLDAHANVNATNDNGETPLHFAVGANLPDAAQSLLGHGADINARDNKGATPLFWAAVLHHQRMTELLLSQKADPNITDNEGRTPLDATKLSVSYFISQEGPELGVTRWQLPLAAGPVPLGIGGYPGAATPNDSPQQIAAVLREHGALEDLPRPNQIVLRRSSANYSTVVFTRGTNDWSQFSLLDLLAVAYDIAAGAPEGNKRAQLSMKDVAVQHGRLAYPDLSRITVRRLKPDRRSWDEQTIDLRPLFEDGDCSKNVKLEWGDVVELPEADHVLAQDWSGFSDKEASSMAKCLLRTIDVVVKGKHNPLVIDAPQRPPPMDPYAHMPGVRIVTDVPFWIRPALRASNLLLASSDLAHIKLIRSEAGIGRKMTWIVDCSDQKPAPDLWLQDGDVIEVPERE